MLAYPAKIIHSRKDKAYLVTFFDFPNINTYGLTLKEALDNASDALVSAIAVDFERGFKMPEPTKRQGINIYLIALPLHIEVPLKLRRLRGKRSQQEIASRLNISAQAYQKLEHPSKCNITLRRLESLGEVFGSSFHLSVQETPAKWIVATKKI